MTTVLLVLAITTGLYMAWNIGANDVANAFGMSVGSGAVTIRRAIVLAAICEFCGAFFVGAPVARTISGSMVDPLAFSATPDLAAVWPLGMLAALIGASLWLNVATFLAQPVSTTHAIIGAVIGFAAVSVGPSAVCWSNMGAIALSWVVSPLAGGTLAFVIYRWGVQRLILKHRHPVFMAAATLPFWTGGLAAIIAFSVVYKGLPRLRLNLSLGWALPLAAGAGLIAGVLFRLGTRRRMGIRAIRRERTACVERWFGYMQIGTACYMSFAHGANDVANAIGPLAVVFRSLMSGAGPTRVVDISPGLLALGGIGIVLGLATYGYKVIESVGRRITEVTPTRGFSADFATATTVLFFSKLGMPISTTFVIVGAVMGVGFARGFGAIDLRVIRRIFASWIVTIPISAVLTAATYWALIAVFR